ncbi:SurA N-terminal domain-containing protein [Paracoccus saliphilus]|uniref:SurA N-terminal domain-containing protein n=1 Tax=Paracoccus saliphilus TaxID=405559 RepID=A0ABY7SEI4_9RHOB|nr:SurA N-terminal domain-containing protein [Paracoccus saliphilus]
MRTKGKSTIVWILMGLLILGLGGFGVTSFSGGSSEIGSVGATKVTAEDYTRALRSELSAYSQQAGQQFTMAQAQSIGLPRAIQGQLFTAAALEEETRRLGISVGDQRVAESISTAPAFQGPNGSFDRSAYSQILRREGLSEAEFEQQVRVDEARVLLQRAVSGGVVAPESMIDQTAKWLLEQRDFSWHEVGEGHLTSPISEPDEETLEAWHKANTDRFTAPEKRKLSYVWLTPNMHSDEVDLDEAALRDVYEARIEHFRQPERRMVSTLVYPSMEDAQSARDRLDAGEVAFDALVAERGLTMEDVDQGEVTREDLGQAGDTVFGLDAPGVVGPVETDLGPALISMNAILEPIDISFEEAREDLRAEAALDRAARAIEDRMGEYEDLLASGATLEEVSEETPMEFGTLAWSSDMKPEEGSIAGYPAFRELADEVGEGDFPQIGRLNDGGIFALRLDEVVPPTLIPFDEIRDEVAEDWRAAEIHRLLLARAEEERLQEISSTTPDPDAGNGEDGEETVAESPSDSQESEVDEETAAVNVAPDLGWTAETGLTRDGWIDGLPAELITQAFEIEETGDIEIVDTDDRVFLVRLDTIEEADLDSEDAKEVQDRIRQRMSQSLQADIFEYYARAAQRKAGVKINQSAIDAINAQVQ